MDGARSRASDAAESDDLIFSPAVMLIIVAFIVAFIKLEFTELLLPTAARTIADPSIGFIEVAADEKEPSVPDTS